MLKWVRSCAFEYLNMGRGYVCVCVCGGRGGCGGVGVCVCGKDGSNCYRTTSLIVRPTLGFVL